MLRAASLEHKELLSPKSNAAAPSSAAYQPPSPQQRDPNTKFSPILKQQPAAEAAAKKKLLMPMKPPVPKQQPGAGRQSAKQSAAGKARSEVSAPGTPPVVGLRTPNPTQQLPARISGYSSEGGTSNITNWTASDDGTTQEARLDELGGLVGGSASGSSAAVQKWVVRSASACASDSVRLKMQKAIKLAEQAMQIARQG